MKIGVLEMEEGKNSSHGSSYIQEAPLNSEEFLGKNGVTAKAADGVYTIRQPKILKYEFGKISPLLAPFICPSITVCDSMTLWMHHVMWVVYALLLMLICGFNCFPESVFGEGGACAKNKNINICSVNSTLEDAKAEYRFLVAFILAGYVATSVGRWKERRKNYASLCGNVRNMLVNLMTFVPLDPMDQYLVQKRQNLARWTLLAYELAVAKPRGMMDQDEFREYLAQSDLLHQNEWEKMVPGDRHTTVFSWIQAQIVNMMKQGYLSVLSVQQISLHITSMRAQANDLMSSLDRDTPVPYVIVCGMLVTINIFIMSTWKGIEWSIWLNNFGGPNGFNKGLLNQGKFWIDLLVLFGWNISYQALYDLGYILDNPFQNRPIDVPHEVISAGLRKLANALAQGSDILPPDRKSVV